MLALAINDPAFGLLYVSVIAVLTAGLVFSYVIPVRWLRVLQLLAVLALGFFIGMAVAGVYGDISGTAPLSIARTLGVAPVSTNGTVPVPKVGPPDAQISVDVFQPDTAQGHAAPERVPVKAGAAILIEGWAFDAQDGTLCGAIDVAVDGKPTGLLKYGLPRPDVGAFFKDTQHLSTGFGGTISTRGLHPGEHLVRVRCIASTSNVAYPGLQPHELLVTK